MSKHHITSDMVMITGFGLMLLAIAIFLGFMYWPTKEDNNTDDQ